MFSLFLFSLFFVGATHVAYAQQIVLMGSATTKGSMGSRVATTATCVSLFSSAGTSCSSSFALLAYSTETQPLSQTSVPPSGPSFSGSFPIVGPTSVSIATNWSSLFTQPLLHSFLAAGVVATSPDHLWTGFNSSGFLDSYPNCADWTSPSVSVVGLAVSSSYTGADWTTAHGTLACNNNEHFACVCIPFTGSPTTASPTPPGFTFSPTLATASPSTPRPSASPIIVRYKLDPGATTGIALGCFFGGYFLSLLSFFAWHAWRNEAQYSSLS